MEPDWYQYHDSATQQGGGLSHDYMVGLFNRMTDQIFRALPRAKISLDISPWVNDQKRWLEPFMYSCRVDFVHTSGGRTTANHARIRPRDNGNLVTWEQVAQASGKGIIADTGYGVGGYSQGHDDLWDDERNLLQRIGDGVVAVTQDKPAYRWSDTLETLRTTLPRPPVCSWEDPTYPPPAPPPVDPRWGQMVLASALRSSTIPALIAAAGPPYGPMPFTPLPTLPLA